jgi:hypothetical protein
MGCRCHSKTTDPVAKRSLKKVSGEAAKRQRNVAAEKLPGTVTVR